MVKMKVGVLTLNICGYYSFLIRYSHRVKSITPSFLWIKSHDTYSTMVK